MRRLDIIMMRLWLLVASQWCVWADSLASVRGAPNDMAGQQPGAEQFTSRKHKNERRLNAPYSGTYRAFVLLTRFAGHEDRDLPPPSYFQSLCDGPLSDDINPVGSIADWFDLASANDFSISCYVTEEWYANDGSESSYAQGNSGLTQTDAEANEMFKSSMDRAQTNLLLNNGGDLNDKWHLPFDANQDGSFDIFLTIHSGYPGEVEDACDNTTAQDRLIARATSDSTNGWVSDADWTDLKTTRIMSWGYSSAFADGSCTSPPAKMGPLLRNIIRQFGVPDLDDSSLSDSGRAAGGIGMFGIMATPNGPFGTSGEIPGTMSPYTKQYLGWADVRLVESDGPIDILDSQRSNQIYRIDHGFADGEYLLIENRLNTNFDANMPTGGIVFYHVDENVATVNEETSYPGQVFSDWPNTHYMVRVIQKDGLFQIESGANPGDAGDFWGQRDTLFPSGTEGREPNTDSYYNGPTNITIRVMTDSSWDMQFWVSGISDPPLEIPGLITPAPTSAAPTRSPTVSPTDAPTPVPTISSRPTIPPFPLETAHPALPTLRPQAVVFPPTFPPQGVTIPSSDGGTKITAHPAMIVLYILISIASIAGVVYLIRLLKRLREEGDGIEAADANEDKDLVQDDDEDGSEDRFEDEDQDKDSDDDDSSGSESGGDDSGSSSGSDSDDSGSDDSDDDDDSGSDSSEESRGSIV